MDDLKNICVCILTGGKGTRLRSVLPDLPKGLAPVMGRPFLSYILDGFEKRGVARTILCTGYMGEAIRTNLGLRHGRMELVYSQEQEPLDTGGALRLALPHMNTETVLVVNGDTYVDTDYLDFLEKFESTGKQVGILLVPKENTERYGRVSVDKDGLVTDFSEKGKVGAGWVSSGVYLFRRSVFKEFPEMSRVSLENDIFPPMVGESLTGFYSDSEMIDIGTEKAYQKAEQFFLNIFGEEIPPSNKLY